MKIIEITAAELVRQSEIYLDAAMEGNIVCVEKAGRHVCILGDEYWKFIVEIMSKLLPKKAR